MKEFARILLGLCPVKTRITFNRRHPLHPPRKSLLPSSERDRAHQIVRSLSMKNMNIAQVVPKSGSMRRLPVRGVANTRANDDFLSSSSDEDLIHQEEDHHNTVINGKKGPHEL